MKFSHKLVLTISLIIILMYLSNLFFIQIDFTSDKRIVYQKVL